MRPERFDPQTIIDAIKQAQGIKATAAANLKCSRQTVTNYIDRYPAVKAAYQEAVESTIDLAQSKLIVLVEREEWPAIRFMLATLGKDRGFTERTEFQQIGGEDDFEQFDAEVRKVYGKGHE